MKKIFRIFLSIVFAFPLLAFAQQTNGQSPSPAPVVDLGDPIYSVSADVFYWGTSVTTPNFTSSPASFGGELDVRVKRTMFKNFGFGIEYTQTATGPRFIDTGGVCTTSFGGFTGFAVPTGPGTCGLVSPGNFQFGGGKVKYFLPIPSSALQFAVYGDYFSMTGGRGAWGGGLEMDYRFTRDWSINAYADYDTVNGSGFPVQNLFRYQAALKYTIPDTPIDILAGYRAYNFSKYYNSTIGGYIIGVGTHF